MGCTIKSLLSQRLYRTNVCAGKGSASLCTLRGTAGGRSTRRRGSRPHYSPAAIMPDDIHRAPTPRARPPQETSVLSTMAALERRYDGPIPARDYDAARYPTLARRIVRARARAAAAREAAARRMADWRREVAHARQRAMGEAALGAAAAAARRVHMPHLRYYIREARSWAAHLGELEAQERARRQAGNATSAGANDAESSA